MSRPDPVKKSAAPGSDESGATPDSFESALERLEGIVSRMEGERLPLEELLACYEQGTRLLKSCGDYLTAAEHRIELISKDETGQPRTTDFSAAAAAPAAAASAENRPGNLAEPNPKGRGGASSRDGKAAASSAATASRSSGHSTSSSSTSGSTDPGTQPAAGPADPTSPRTNHEVSLF